MGPPTTAFLASLSSSLRRPSASYLIPALVSTALGHGSTWLPAIYKHEIAHLPPSSAVRTHSPPPLLETNPRRLVLRQLKEGLVKSAILVGVPKVIEGLLELNEVVAEGDRDDWFVRGQLDDEWRRRGEREDRGTTGIERIYRRDIDAIWAKMAGDMEDVRWISTNITYGTFLTPDLPPENASQLPQRDPLAHDPALLSVVTLASLIPQRTSREILWHLRGALRNGMCREEVEEIHRAVERVCVACGVEGVRDGMPRVQDIEFQEGEGARKLPPPPAAWL